ncbi:MAG: hypothetical protein ACR2GD_01745 [Pyrinomonadaceae bacterium]
MQVILFSTNYYKLLLSVWLGKRLTPYPLGVIWRWRHKDYKDL